MIMPPVFGLLLIDIVILLASLALAFACYLSAPSVGKVQKVRLLFLEARALSLSLSLSALSLATCRCLSLLLSKPLCDRKCLPLSLCCLLQHDLPFYHQQKIYMNMHHKQLLQ